MDKRQVIAAYRRGTINIRECAQILGIDIGQISCLIDLPEQAAEPRKLPVPIRGKRSVNG